MGGACIEDAYFDARNLHGRSIQTTNEIITYALQSITNNIQMPGKNPDNEWNLVVWNLNCAAFDGLLEAELQWAWEFPWYEGGIELIDEKGIKIPCQVIHEKSVIPGFRSRIVFKVEIPSLGYRSFVVKKTNEPICRVTPKAAKSAANQHFCIDISSGVPKLYENGKLLTNCFMQPYAVEDKCDTWGFNKTVYESKKYYLTLETAEITEDGAYITRLKTTWRFRHSLVEIYYTLSEACIDCSYRVLWQETGFALKLGLLNSGACARCIAASPYGCAERARSDFEKPMGEYLSFISDDCQYHIAANSVFAYNFSGSEIGLTLLRNCIFGDLRTRELEKADFSYMGQGEICGSLRIFTHERKNPSVDAMLFNNPPRILTEANHLGLLKPSDTFFSCDNDTVCTTVVKKQEDGNKLVVRSFNTDRESTQSGHLKLFDKQAAASFLPEEIKTLTENENGFCESSMLEEN